MAIATHVAAQEDMSQHTAKSAPSRIRWQTVLLATQWCVPYSPAPCAHTTTAVCFCAMWHGGKPCEFDLLRNSPRAPRPLSPSPCPFLLSRLLFTRPLFLFLSLSIHRSRCIRPHHRTAV